MKKLAKKRWLEALRSGEYQQGRAQLVASSSDGVDRFCCLGVAYDCLIDGYWKLDDYGQWAASGDSVYLPPSIEKQIGLSHGEARVLAQLNDHGKTFAEIADYIEEHL